MMNGSGLWGCTVADPLWVGVCGTVTATGVRIRAGVGCSVALVYLSNRCRSEQARICRSSL